MFNNYTIPRRDLNISGVSVWQERSDQFYENYRNDTNNRFNLNNQIEQNNQICSNRYNRIDFNNQINPGPNNVFNRGSDSNVPKYYEAVSEYVRKRNDLKTNRTKEYEEYFYGYTNEDKSILKYTKGSEIRTKRIWEKKPKKKDFSQSLALSLLINDFTLPEEVRKMFLPLECNLCQAHLTSTVMAKVHYSSNAHEKRLRKWLEDYSKSTGTPLHERAKIQPNKNKEDDKNPKYFFCEVCQINLTGKLHAESHYMGRSHQRVLIGKSEPPAKKSKLNNKNLSLVCEICGVFVTSYNQMEAHLSGQKHKKKVQAIEIQGECKEISDDNTNIFCDVCHIYMNSKLQMMHHLQSKKHMKKAEMEGKNSE